MIIIYTVFEVLLILVFRHVLRDLIQQISESSKLKFLVYMVFVLQVAIDSATPVEDSSARGNFPMDEPEPFLGYGGPMRAYGSAYGRMYGSLDFNDVSRATNLVLKFVIV